MQQAHDYRYMYDVALMGRAQDLILKRKETNMSQSYMACLCGVSLKSIQRFETMKAMSGYLCFAYHQILNGSATI